MNSSEIIKRSFDLLLVIIALLPVALCAGIIAIMVRLTSAGPALFWSRRIGQHGHEFLMPKFRTMRTDTPQLATHLMIDPEKWLTPIGSFLRKSSLDELPQLYSVLKGDMSLVGPRPALFNQNDLIDARTKAKVDVLKPGVTGLAQISGRDELAISEKVKFDINYLESRSTLLDLKIILATIVKVISRNGVIH